MSLYGLLPPLHKTHTTSRSNKHQHCNFCNNIPTTELMLFRAFQKQDPWNKQQISNFAYSKQRVKNSSAPVTHPVNQPKQSRSISQLITWNRQLKPIPDAFRTRQHFQVYLKIPTQFQHDICGIFALSFFFLSMEIIFRFVYILLY